MLGLHGSSIVSAETLLELLWGDDPPRTAAKALQTHISALRRTLDDGFVLTEGTGWVLTKSDTDASRYKVATKIGRDAAAAGDSIQAVAYFDEALTLWRGIPELPDTRRGVSEKTRWIEGHAALVEDRADALLATGRAAEIIGELEAAVSDAPLRERRWGQLMLALYRAGRQGEALAAYQRARSLLADELGVDPGPELRRLEAAIVSQDASLEVPVGQQLTTVTRAVTFLLTDIEGSTAAWEADADAMAIALARHDELAEQVVTSRGGRLLKTRGEGDATFSVFDRPSAAAAAALELQDAIAKEPWALTEPIRIRIALHTGEAELRDGDYFGRAVNRAARLRSLASGGQILCSGATAELAIDSLPDDVVFDDLGMRQLKNLARPEHVFELRLQATEDSPTEETTDAPLERPSLPTVLIGPGPFVGRTHELEGLVSVWETARTGGIHAVLIAGEPGVGKTRLAGEWSQRAYQQGAVVLYGRCDEDLGAPYQPFAEALRSLMPCIGATRLRGLRGVEALLALVPGLTDVLPDLTAPSRADPDTERYALFDAVVALLEVASASAPVVVVLDDLHWAAKPTLLLLRHLLRFGDQARVQIVGTYRSTDLDRSHPLAAMLADLHRSTDSGTANRLQLSGLDEGDVTAYVSEAGYDDEELARALASVTGGNPFFLIEALRHVDESGGVWDPTTLPQGVRETVSRRLSRLSPETNKALAAAAVVGSRFAVDLVERVVEQDLVDAFDEACKAGIVIEEPGGLYRFNHAIVRRSLLAELASVRRMRLHQRIAATLETEPGADDELLADLAHHYFECAWAGNAAKAVEYCRRAADQAMARLGYEGAAELYDRALHALEELDDELPDRDDQAAELLIARCEALLAAGDVSSAAGAVSQLQAATVDSVRLAAWATCFDGELSMLIHPDRLDEVETALGTAAEKLARLDDAAGEAKAHTVRATCLARLGRIADCEIALDEALTAARRAREHRRVNAVLAGAPLAALWGPNPVPRAGGRCLDVVRLLRITTDSPAVEATSTRCQAVLEAFRGRGAAARRMIDSARRTVTDLGLRHALLEVEQFAGIVELVIDDPAAAEAPLRKAYHGFRRMGLDADTAETAALLGRACLLLDRDTDADELCTESEHLAGHALKPSIAWRTLRSQLLSRSNDHDAARRFAEAAVSLAERTDLLVDHGDACLALANVLATAGDVAGVRAAAERAVSLWERKGAAALVEKARVLLDVRKVPTAPAPPEAPTVEPDTPCVRVGKRAMDAAARGAWDEFEQVFAPHVHVESRRKVVGFTQIDVESSEWAHENRRIHETDRVRPSQVVIAVRGDRLALTRLELGTADMSPGAPRDELLQLYGIDIEGRIALHVFFDVDDMDAAVAELDATHARFEEEQHTSARRLQNAASQVYERIQACFAARDWDAMANLMAQDMIDHDRRHGVNAEIRRGRDAEIANSRAVAELGSEKITSNVTATRGNRLALCRSCIFMQDNRIEFLSVIESDTDDRLAAHLAFDVDDFDAAIAELDARYLAVEAAPYADTWAMTTAGYASLNRHELPATTQDWVNIDHRAVVPVEAGVLGESIRAVWDLVPRATNYVETVHRLSSVGTVTTHAVHATSPEGFDAEWRDVILLTFEGERINRCEIFDESDLDVAIAGFEQLDRPARRLENAATQAYERMLAFFEARDWVALSGVVAEAELIDDRRRVVNGGLRHGRDAGIEELRAAADIGFTITMVDVRAARGERLALARVRAAGRDPAAIQNDVLQVVQIDSDERIAEVITFDLDDFEAAIAELDARYLAGEAATYARTWSVVAKTFTSVNQHELPATTHDCVTLDHRSVTAFEPGELTAYIRASWDLAAELNVYIEAAHRLSDLGAVYSYAAQSISHEGFDGEWRGANVVTVQGDMINRCELFDEGDLDAALARFEQLSRPGAQLQNKASKVADRFFGRFAIRDWDAIGEVLAEDVSVEDRRRAANAGIRRGRAAEIEDLQAAASVGFADLAPTVIATRGERLILSRTQATGHDPEAIRVEILQVIEIDANERIAALLVFELDDLEAAFAELEARYLAGEAAAHAATWSVITGALVAHNRREVAAATPDVVSIDHRRVASFAPGEGIEYIRAGWDLDISLDIFVETPHRVNDFGAVFTWAAYGSSDEGFAAEWRGVEIMMVDGEMLSRAEVFDEADLAAALAKFDELSRPTPRLENAASQVYECFLSCFASRDWETMAEILDDEVCIDDRRRMANAGTRFGRDAEIEDSKAAANVGFTKLAPIIIATRGERLILSRTQATGYDPEAIRIEVFHLIEIDTEERIVALVVFELDDFDDAIEELDRRYLAGEAAAHAQTWSVLAKTCALFNQHELPTTTPDSVYVDHRPVLTVEAVDLPAYLRGVWDQTPDARIYTEAVHRLSNDGAVVTHAVRGTSPEGFNAEWRMIDILTVEGSRISRCEVFDESDLEGALARFEQLGPPAPRLENAASRAYERIYAWFAARDWDAMAANVAHNFSSEDRRRVVNAGIRRGRDAGIEDVRAIADVGFTLTLLGIVAIRGGRLALVRVRAAGPDPGTIQNDALNIVEIDAEERIVASISFDLDNFDAAIAELDARYLAGEAAPYAHTWSVITGIYAAFNRHELPATDWVTIDHRRATPFAPGTILASIRAIWDLTPDLNIHVEAVHQLSKLGAVITHVQRGTSSEGFDVEWRQIQFLRVDDDRIDRCEIFDETDLDAALARFEELHPNVPQLENAASQVLERVFTYFAARDWNALAELVAEDICSEDRRPVVNAGIRHGRDAEVADMRAIADVGAKYATITAMATRAAHLALCHVLLAVEDQGSESFRTEALCLVEVNADHRVAARLLFGLDDIDAAIEELDARFLAGEAAPYARTWSVISSAYAAMNRHELFPTTPDWVNIDHRRPTIIVEGRLNEFLESLWKLAPDVSFRVEAVHRLNNLGAVCSHVAQGISQDGFEAEWRGIEVMAVDRGLISRCEIFDATDLDAALTRFEELQPRSPRLKSAVADRFLTHFATRDWDAMAQDFAENYHFDDRRRVINAGIYRGRDAAIKDLRVATDIGLTTTAIVDIIASRGERRILTHWRASGPDPDAVQFDVLQVLEFDTDERVAAAVIFDLDDIDAAFAELDARYVADEAAAHARTWSVITDTYAAFNRHDLTKADWAVVDHRRVALFASSNMVASVRASWEQTPDLSIRIEAVHRISAVGAVVTHIAHGTSPDGFDAEWRMIQVLTLQGDHIGGCELFDEVDLDAALARFEELQTEPRQVENAASRVEQSILASFVVRDWDAMAGLIADDIRVDDRRRVVNAGAYLGRDAEIASLRALAGVGVTNMTAMTIATRGQRLVLSRHCVWDHWSGPGTSKALAVVEINAQNQVVSRVIFDPDDFEAAIAELDARYAAGEASTHAEIWSLVARITAEVNRQEVPATTPDSVYIDHRPLVSIEGVDLAASLHALWDITSAFSAYVDAVHRLDELGTVVTQVVNATMREGDAELRYIEMVTFEGDLISRVECFDEADLDTALARFNELHFQARRLENAASQVFERFLTHYVARDWDVVSEMLAEDIFNDDRRRVVSAGVRRGRDATIASMRASADLGLTSWASTVIATRGELLALSRDRISVRDEQSEAVVAEVLGIVEIDADERIVTRIALDLEDFDAAIAELDDRYVAGEAATYADTWSVIAGVQAAVNRRELPAMTTNPGYIDHRPLVSIEGPDLASSIRAVFDIFSTYDVYVEEVHRLEELGAVYTQVHTGTSHDGVDAELRMIEVQTVEGGLLSRAEVFDEADLDVALARFDELQPQAPGLENAASRLYARSNAYLAARDWDAIAELLADNVSTDDRRRVVGGGVQRGRNAQIANMQAVVDLGVNNIEAVVIATRGERLALTRTRVSGGAQGPEAFSVEMLNIVETNADNRIAAAVQFDPDDIDAAFAELDARYLAGEAATQAQAWSLVARTYAAVNRRELPATTPDAIYIDRRPIVSIEGVDLAASLRALWDITSAFSVYAEAVHRLDALGTVVTQVVNGTSQEGLDTEVRTIGIFTIEGGLFSRVEIFDDADLDTALARFDELHAQTRRPRNRASQVVERFLAHFAARDWDAITEVLNDGYYNDDRRRAVGAGLRRGRESNIAEMQTTVDLGVEVITSQDIATRGEHLLLSRVRWSANDESAGGFHTEALGIVELDAAERIAAIVTFDPDDIDAAFAELDARYLAGEAADHAQTWTNVTEAQAAYNRHEVMPTTQDWINIDHRRGRAFAPGDMIPYIRATYDMAPNVKGHIESVHRLSSLGAVITEVVTGTSHEGFDFELREIAIFTFDGDMVSRFEMFDEADLDAALARFDEVHRSAPLLENVATRARVCVADAFNLRDVEGLLALNTADARYDDRRRGLRDEGLAARPELVRGIFEAPKGWRLEVAPLAVRGSRLALTRDTYRDINEFDRPITNEHLMLTELDADGLVRNSVIFDSDDLDAAFEELDARYVAGEAAAHAHTWSVIAGVTTALNRHELPSADWVVIDHRRGTPFALRRGSDTNVYASIGAIWDLTPDLNIYIEAAHRLSNLGAVVTWKGRGTSQEGFEAEWRMIQVPIVEGDLIQYCELFDETDLDAALARFDELDRPVPRLENASTRTWSRLVDAYNRRDMSAFLAMMTEDIQLDDRRKGLRARLTGLAVWKNVQELFQAPTSWRLSMQAIAIRGSHLSLTRHCIRDIGAADQPITWEVLSVMEVGEDDLMREQVTFDPDNINDAFDELTARWIASGEVAHPEVIEAVQRLNEISNRHDWDAIAASLDGAAYVSHRQLAHARAETIDDYMSSIRTLASLVPDYRAEYAQILAHSGLGVLADVVVRGTSTEGVAIEIPLIQLGLLDRDRVTRVEFFDPDQRDMALARFNELSRMDQLE
ncbi:nuclear transport factor 2 family protein [Mycobacterium sp. E2479]|uniref:nuclear transport factor 2 family protein n=1 Tax=Mycobacterium sp. E2479 TaxID=1834134 RepID=UPI001E331929